MLVCCRVPFFYVYIVIIYASWLLRHHYKVFSPSRPILTVLGMCVCGCHCRELHKRDCAVRLHQEYARLRQQYIVQGEVSVNKWHEHFMRQGTRRGAASKELPPVRPQANSFQSMVQSWTGLGRREDEVCCAAGHSAC